MHQPAKSIQVVEHASIADFFRQGAMASSTSRAAAEEHQLGVPHAQVHQHIYLRLATTL